MLNSKKSDRPLSVVSLPRFSSAVIHNLTLDLLRLLRAALMLFLLPALLRVMSVPTIRPGGAAGISPCQMMAVKARVSTLDPSYGQKSTLYTAPCRPYSTLYLGIWHLLLFQFLPSFSLFLYFLLLCLIMSVGRNLTKCFFTDGFHLKSSSSYSQGKHQ